MADAYPYIAEAAIKFPTGRLSLVEIQQIFQTIPFELDLIDRRDAGSDCTGSSSSPGVASGARHHRQL